MCVCLCVGRGCCQTEWQNESLSVYVCALLVSCAGTYSKCYMFERSDSLSNPSISSYFPSLPSCFFLPSFLPPFLPSVLPHHSPVTWYSYNPLRHVLMLFFFFFCFLLSVGTHPHTLFHSISLNPSLRLFRLSLEREKASKRERERERYCMVWYFCGSHYVNLLFVCLCLFTV